MRSLQTNRPLPPGCYPLLCSAEPGKMVAPRFRRQSMHCMQFHVPPLTRRQMLLRCANGFGAVALAGLLSDKAYGAGPASASSRNDPMVPRPPHFPPRAKNVIFLFMDGGPSQVDTFDPKPRLAKEHGQRIKMKVP